MTLVTLNSSVIGHSMVSCSLLRTLDSGVRPIFLEQSFTASVVRAVSASSYSSHMNHHRITRFAEIDCILWRQSSFNYSQTFNISIHKLYTFIFFFNYEYFPSFVSFHFEWYHIDRNNIISVFHSWLICILIIIIFLTSAMPRDS